MNDDFILDVAARDVSMQEIKNVENVTVVLTNERNASSRVRVIAKTKAPIHAQPREKD